MGDGVAVEGDGPPVAEITIRVWSLDHDTCDEEIAVQWLERREGGSLALYRLLRIIVDEQIRRLERRSEQE